MLCGFGVVKEYLYFQTKKHNKPLNAALYFGVKIMRISVTKASILLLLLSFLSFQAFATESPPVKKSKSGICHPKGGTYYSRTKNYTPYSSMEACIKSGGRRPKK
jgi:hypothetical protein